MILGNRKRGNTMVRTNNKPKEKTLSLNKREHLKVKITPGGIPEDSHSKTLLIINNCQKLYTLKVVAKSLTKLAGRPTYAQPGDNKKTKHHLLIR